MQEHHHTSIEYELKRERDFCNKSATKSNYHRGKSRNKGLCCELCNRWNPYYARFLTRTEVRTVTKRTLRKVAKGDINDRFDWIC
jgi:hypothetical protein